MKRKDFLKIIALFPAFGLKSPIDDKKEVPKELKNVDIKTSGIKDVFIDKKDSFNGYESSGICTFKCSG